MSKGPAVLYDKSMITDNDIYLFNEGSHFRLYQKLGAHPVRYKGQEGACFGVWAPNARQVSVIGDFNNWEKTTHPLRPRGQSGIWEGFIPDVTKGFHYKYFIQSHHNGYMVEKADPFAVYTETPPRTASVVWDLEYSWNDRSWMNERSLFNNLQAPMSVYEAHLGSWMRIPEEGNRSLTYRELAHRLAQYVRDTGFTHVELLPIMEHPFYGSWGYQTLGYFAPSSRFGQPQDFMYLIDCLHQHGIGVILDWVPSHFPKDEYGLAFFDGTHLYEHADPAKGIHPDWDSCIYNYGRKEVQSFLISNAIFWLDKYHVDGIRIDAVASMLYLDYGHNEGEWIPNKYGGRENIEAIFLLQRLNHEVYTSFPDAQTIAEESTSWPMVTRPAYIGGLGFGMKWDMGWMHDILEYMSKDPVHRKHHHNNLTFRMIYAFHENFVLSLSHDEVVYGKGSLIRKMPGDDWQKFANLRLLFSYMYAQPGKKLLFMGSEFGQWNEWDHEAGLDWHLLDYPLHSGMARMVSDLNYLHKSEPSLHELDFDPQGFEWIDCNDSQQSVLSLLRKGREEKERIIVVCNFTPVPRVGYRIGAPAAGTWQEVFNSDAGVYGGSGLGNSGQVEADYSSLHGQPFSLTIVVPPLAAVYFKIKAT
jgi:1,4-alpha-glucan branching enzyme